MFPLYVAADTSHLETAIRRMDLKVPVIRWSSSQLHSVLSQCGVEEAAGVLKARKTTGQYFLRLTLNNLIEDFGLKVGPALKVEAIVKELGKMSRWSTQGTLSA